MNAGRRGTLRAAATILGWSLGMPFLGFAIFTPLAGFLPALGFAIFGPARMVGFVLYAGWLPSLLTAAWSVVIRPRLGDVRTALSAPIFAVASATGWWAIIQPDAVDFGSYAYRARMAAAMASSLIAALAIVGHARQRERVSRAP